MHTKYNLEYLKGRNYLSDLRTDGREISRSTKRNNIYGYVLNPSGSQYNPVIGSCGQGVASLGSTEDRNS
jgi:hypothetical protein